MNINESIDIINEKKLFFDQDVRKELINDVYSLIKKEYSNISDEEKERNFQEIKKREENFKFRIDFFEKVLLEKKEVFQIIKLNI